METASANQRLQQTLDFFKDIPSGSPLQSYVPAAVEQDYKPSGKISGFTVPILMGTGIAGMAVGVGVAWLIEKVSLWVFTAFDEAGFCLNIIYLPAGVLYLLTPLAIPLFGGLGVAMGGTVSNCRSPKVGAWVGVAIGLASCAAAIYYTFTLFSGLDYIVSVLDKLEMGLSTVLTTIGLGLFYGLAIWVDHYIWFGLLILISIAAATLLAREAGTTPYCEHAKRFLKENVVKTIDLPEIPKLLVGLCLVDESLLRDLKVADKDAAERLDVILWTTTGQYTNILEVKAWFEEIAYTKRGEKKSATNRLVYSQQLNKEEMQKVCRLLSINDSAK